MIWTEFLCLSDGCRSSISSSRTGVGKESNRNRWKCRHGGKNLPERGRPNGFDRKTSHWLLVRGRFQWFRRAIATLFPFRREADRIRRLPLLTVGRSSPSHRVI